MVEIVYNKFGFQIKKSLFYVETKTEWCANFKTVQND